MSAIPAGAERPAHRDPNVLRWLGAYGSSMIGDSVYFIALSWAAARSGSAAQAGLVMAVSAVPRALLMLYGGVIADRLGPRRVVIGSDAVRFAVILVAAGLLVAVQPGIWFLALIALVFGAVDAVFMPAVGALPPRITGPSQLARVQGLRGLAGRIALVTGGPLGGFAVALGGSAAAFAVAAGLFGVSLVLLLAVRVRKLTSRDETGTEGAAPEKGQLRAGLRYIRRHRVLLPLIVAMGVTELGFSGPANIGIVLLADERGWGASGMGLAISAFGVGAGAASLLLAVRGRLPRAGLLRSVCEVFGAVALAAIAFAPSPAVGAVACLFVGLLGGMGGALSGALLQTQSDPAYIGRVTSVYMLIAVGLAPLCYPVVGAAIGVWGTRPVFVACASLILVGSATGLASKPLRKAELPGGQGAFVESASRTTAAAANSSGGVPAVANPGVAAPSTSEGC
ncbi:MFS transporter [Streptomyces indicus]|uniref:Predicted arabinose efflux permease, MFS family n=1 Tax=Streptomyces indicus TaxID=417292 RepID=A0A1G8Z0I9_9ACTN|nr:MFS transporter [Streptomyces indicus]SDK08649.1 Predicted arabinose efflux permease, MFS family [Streptomyces indicus]